MININLNQEVAVIGGGIVGICTGLFLQQKGYQVTIMDRDGIAQGCSKGNAGHFATEQIFPFADVSLLTQLPKMLLDPSGPISIKFSYFAHALPWFLRFLMNMRRSKFSAHTNALKSLNEQAITSYLPLLKQAGIEHLMINKGSLLTFEKDNRQQVVDAFKAYEQHGIKLQILNRGQVRQIEPNISQTVCWALYFKDVAHTPDPNLFCQGLATLFLSQGGKFEQREVLSLRHRKHDVSVVAERYCETYKKVIIAAGAWSKNLIAPLGYRLPLDTERGYHLMLTKPNPIERPVASAERKFIMTPMLDGLRLAGTVEFAGLHAPANKNRAFMLYPQARKLLSTLPKLTSSDSSWMGCRPSMPDSLPVIGQAPNHRNLFFALGHHHLGLTQGAITGKLIAQLLSGVEPSIDLSPFCISRFN